MVKFILLWLFSVLLSSFSQVILKIAAGRKYENRIKEYLNPLVIGAYTLFFLCTLLTMLALRVVPYSYSPMIESTSYIFIPVFGVFLLKEKISRRRMIGIGVILVGILIFTL